MELMTELETPGAGGGRGGVQVATRRYCLCLFYLWWVENVSLQLTVQ